MKDYIYLWVTEPQVRCINLIKNLILICSRILGLDSFRDEFLNNSIKGRKYITYYYTLGAELKKLNYYTSSNILSDFIFYQKVYFLANSLQNGSDNNTIISAQDQSFLLNKINQFKSLDLNNILYQTILNDIENDIINYTNKSKRQILQTLN